MNALSSRRVRAALALALTVLATASAFAQSGRPEVYVHEFPDAPSVEDIIEARRQDRTERIIDGTVAAKGQWLSMVAIFMKRGDRSANFCGGTVIGKEWVLTAAHCVGAMETARQQNPSTTFFIREGTQDLNSREGRDIRVAGMVAHENYNPRLTLNDVALLRLGNPSSAPLQKLIGRNRVSEDVVAPRMTTVTGFGVTQENGNSSPNLRQVDVPIVPTPKCKQIYGDDRITDANFCAGWDKGGKDSCDGDSGGPIFLPNAAGGEPLQIGVVSWGKDCARAGFPGVYASAGIFEDWVKARVRDVTFVQKGEAASPAAQSAAALTTGAAQAAKPSQLAQLTVDIAEGNRVRVNSFIEIRVTSTVSGAIVLYNENPDGRAYQIYPSKVFPASGPDPALARIEAGKPLSVPSDQQKAQNYRFIIRPPLGINRIRAIVIPDNPMMRDIVRQNFDGRDIQNLATVIDRIVDAELGSRGAEPIKIHPVDRATASKIYEIIN